MKGRIEVVDNVPIAFKEHVESAFAERANPKSFSIALSGGSSAIPCYQELAKADIDWSIVTFVWGDERLVPLDHDDSNYKVAKEVLFDHISEPCAIHPMTTEIGAEGYDKLISGIAPIDVIHLGLGPDGHTASLFPDSPALRTSSDIYVVETGDDLHPHPRMTLTYSGIRASRLVLFTVSGEKKAPMFRKIKAGEDYPATHVEAPKIVWLVDSAANA